MKPDSDSLLWADYRSSSSSYCRVNGLRAYGDSNVRRLLSSEVADEFPEAEFLKELGHVEEEFTIEYAPSQREAIQTALSKPMMILTGGPGTGKTTVIKGIVELYARLHGISLDPKAC